MKQFKNVILLAFSLIFSLLVGEIILRLLVSNTELLDDIMQEGHKSRKVTNLVLHDDQHYFCKGPHKWQMRDPLLEKRGIPNSAYFELNNDVANFINVNEHGFRGPPEPKLGKNGVVVLGDSFTRGTLADETETIPAFLSRWSISHDFLNLGTGGHGTLQHSLTYGLMRAKIDHNAVLMLSFISNDLQDNVEYLNFMRSPYVGKSEAFSNSLLGIELKRIESVLVRTYVVKLVLAARRSLKNFGLDSEPSRNEIALLRQSLIRLKNLTRSKQFFVVTIPGLEEFDRNHTWPRKFPRKYAELVRSAYDQLGAELGFEVLHLGPQDLPVGTGASIEALYGWPDGHFNEHGYYAAAYTISKFLSHKLLNYKTNPEESFINLTQYWPRTLNCPP